MEGAAKTELTAEEQELQAAFTTSLV